MCADHPPHAASAVEVPVRQERTRIPGRPRCSPRDLSERTTCDRQSSPAFGGERRWIGTPTEREPGDVGSNSGDSPPDLQSSSDESDSGMPDESTVATRRIRSHRGVVLTEVPCSRYTLISIGRLSTMRGPGGEKIDSANAVDGAHRARHRP